LVSLLDLGWEVGQGMGVMRWMMIWLLLLAGLLPRLVAGEHWMHGRGVNPLAVPVWDEFFAEGPFRRPEGVERGVAESCREGWAAVLRLDDGAAERWFRAALEREPENGEAMVGLAAANSGMPGRAAAAARQALVVMGEGASGLMRELAAAWVASLSALPSARVSDGASRAELLAAGSRRKYDAGEAAKVLEERLAGLAAGEPLAGLLVARLRLSRGGGGVDDVMMRLGAEKFPGQAMDWLRRPGERPVPPALVAPSAAAAAAWAAGLERAGWLREAAAWFGEAARLASVALTADPGDGRAMRGLHEALCGRARVLASAGMVEEALGAAREAGDLCVLETAVRLEEWGVVRETSGRALAALSGPSLERIRWLHAETLGAARERDLLRMFPKLAAMRGAYEQMRVTPELAEAAGLEAAANLIRETEGWIAVIQGQPVPVWPTVDALVPVVRLVSLMKAAGREAEIPAALKEVVPTGLPEWRAAAAWMASVPDGMVARWSRGEGDGELMPERAMGPMWSPAGAPGLVGMETAGPRVVIFFLGYRCDHCLKQLDIFKLWEARIRAAGASLVAVSVDNGERVARTWAGPDRTKEEPYPFPILADPELGQFKAWGAWDGYVGRPVHGTFVTDGAGKVRWLRTGTEPFYDAGAVVALVEALRVEKGEAGK
jgi:peroxiredoxin